MWKGTICAELAVMFTGKQRENGGEISMDIYHKIQTAYLRNPDNNFKTLLEGQWSKPEFGYLKDCKWEATEKIDGTNVRVIFDGQKVKFNGKSNNAQLHTE